jgi:hypothetical protein
MVGVPASKFCCKASLFVLLVSVPGNHVSCNAKGFMKSSWEPLEEGTIRQGVVAGDAFILWVEKLCLPILFLLSKVIVLFISLFSSHLLWGLAGFELRRRRLKDTYKDWYPIFLSFFILLASFFSPAFLYFHRN